MEKNLIKLPSIPYQLETSNIFTNLKYFGPGAIKYFYQNLIEWGKY